MVRDPHYRRILEALQGHLDWEVFQGCMGDLLREIFPGLVPISGSDDQGMDGAIADGEGEPFSLVCTTSEDVIGNLTRNLDSYLSSGGRRRKVVLATSQKLSPRRRKNLEQRAREKDFTLLQIFDRQGVADRLYYHPQWCNDLLGLSGAPSALSMIPRTHRPLMEIELVGREADVTWLRKTSGDRLISGQPGSGKTYLLHQLVREGWGLFLVGDDRTEIANSIRSQKPRIIVVDDAHNRIDQLETLRHLRHEMHTDFDIVATSWVGEQDDVAESLGSLASSRIRKLELLTPIEILEIYRQAGVWGSDTAMRILVDQAARKPGLAMTLASLCLRGNWEEIREGHALTKSMMTQFKRLVGPQSTDFLAVLGLGGDRGMSLQAASEYLGLGLEKGRKLASGLAAGGVLSERERHLTVWPRDLRCALVAQVFFRDSVTHDYRQVLKRVPDIDSAILTLLGAAHRGARIPHLSRLVARSSSINAWRAFTALGEHQAEWTLQEYSGEVVDLAREALNVAPNTAVPLLLDRAGTTEGPLHSQPHHPLRILEDWVRDVRVLPSEILRRRRNLVRLTKNYLRSGGSPGPGIHALVLTLAPELEGTSPDPANPSAVKYRWGLLPLEHLKELALLWPEFRDAIGDLDVVTWPRFKTVLWGWIHPESVAADEEVPASYKRTMRTVATDILQDLAYKMSGRRGLATSLKRLAARINLSLPLESDSTFEFLYPEDSPFEDPDDPSVTDRLREIASHWAIESEPVSLASQLRGYESDAAYITTQTWQTRIHSACRLLAASVQHPEQWLQEFLDQGLNLCAVSPFIEQIMSLESETRDQLLEICLQTQAYSAATARLVLKSSTVSEHLFELAISLVTPQDINSLAASGELPIETLSAFIRCKNHDFAIAAAVGEWVARPRGSVRRQLLDSWKEKILTAGKTRHEGIHYWLGEILAQDSSLALEWLQRRLRADDLLFLLQDDIVFGRAIAALDLEQRSDLLRKVEETPSLGHLLRRIVDGDPSLYNQLLSRRDLNSYHLSPLNGIPDSAWAQLALRALDNGFGPEEIAAASFARDPFSLERRVVWGAEPGKLREHERAFAALANHPHDDVRRVAACGQQLIRERLDALQAQAKIVSRPGR